MKQLYRLFYLPAWPIAAKLSAALLSVALIPMGFTAYYNLHQSLDSAEVNEYRKLELLAASNASRLDQLIADIQRVVVQVSTEQHVVSFLTSSESAKQGVLRHSVQQTLDNVFHSNPDFDAVYIIDRKGRCLASTDPTFVGQDYAFREYFRSSIRGQPHVSSILVGKTTARPGLYFSSPVRSTGGEILGVAVLKIKGEEIWTEVNQLQVDSQGYAFLIDQQGVIISAPNKSLLYHSLIPLPPKMQQQVVTDRRYGLNQIQSLNLPKLAEAMVGAKEPGYTNYYAPLEQTREMVGFAPLDVQPWVLGVNKPQAQFAAPLERLVWENSYGVLVVGGLAAITALLLARSIARPIRALIAAAQALEQDDFEPQALADASRAQDDIGQLVRVFLQMAQEVKAREQKLKQQVMALNIQIDEAKKTRQVAEVTETYYFQQLQKKVQKLKERTVKVGEAETEYFQQLQQKVQKLRVRAPAVGE